MCLHVHPSNPLNAKTVFALENKSFAHLYLSLCKKFKIAGISPYYTALIFQFRAVMVHAGLQVINAHRCTVAVSTPH